MNIVEETLVFKINNNHDFGSLKINSDIRHFIADVSDTELDIINSIKDKFITFGDNISKMNGSFVIISRFSFSDSLTIVPTLQEAYDYIELEEIERQLNL